MNILFASIAFPPKKDPECIQTARYFKYLSQRSALNIDVLTTAKTLNMPEDIGLEKYDTDYRSKTLINLSESRIWNSIIYRVYPELFFPDFKSQFIRKAVKANLPHEPNLIYSRSFPISSTVAALRLKKKYDVPWVMHLSDPWSYSPLHNYSERALQKHLALERQCLESATLITLTSKKTLDLYQHHFPDLATKFSYFPNVYDPEDFVKNDFQWKEKIRIVHTGGMIGTRNPSFFFDAFDQLVDREKSRFEVIFAGDADLHARGIFQRMTSRYPSLVQYLGLLPLQEAQELQRSADILLAIDNPLQEEGLSLFFPSKLLDYMMMQRKICAITPKGSTTSDVLKEHYIFEHSEINELTAFLRRALQHHEEKKVDFFVNQEIPEEFNAKRQAERLALIFESYA